MNFVCSQGRSKELIFKGREILITNIQTGARPWITKIKCRGENSKREGSYPERHVESLAEAETWEAARTLRLRALSCRPGGHLRTIHVQALFLL